MTPTPTPTNTTTIAIMENNFVIASEAIERLQESLLISLATHPHEHSDAIWAIFRAADEAVVREDYELARSLVRAFCVFGDRFTPAVRKFSAAIEEASSPI